MENRIENLLNQKSALKYWLRKHNILRVRRELYGSSDELYNLFTEEIIEANKFKTELLDCLGPDKSARSIVAKNWAIFIKNRISVLESWSGRYATIVAIFGLAIALFSLVNNVGRVSDSNAILAILIIGSSLLLYKKFYLDIRSSWYKFVVTHLEQINDDFSLSSKTESGTLAGH